MLSNELKFIWGVALADVNGDWLARFWWSLPANHLPGGKKRARCLECKCGLIDTTKHLQNPVIAACEIAAVMPALMPPSLRFDIEIERGSRASGQPWRATPRLRSSARAFEQVDLAGEIFEFDFGGLQHPRDHPPKADCHN